MDVVAANFEQKPTFGALPAKDVKNIVNLLSLDLPLELVGTVSPRPPPSPLQTSHHLHLEHRKGADDGGLDAAWGRAADRRRGLLAERALHRWSKCEISGHGSSWKQLYFEKYIEETIERFDPLLSDIDDLRRLLTFASPFVRNLIIQQIPSHIDLQIIFNCMPSALCSLSLSYGMRNVGMDYDRSLFGMKLSDCRSLARSLEISALGALRGGDTIGTPSRAARMLPFNKADTG